MKTLRNTFLALLALPLLLASPSGQAQGLLPGFKVEKATTNPQDIDHPGITNVLDEPSIFKDGFDKTWIANKAKIDQIMQANIAYGNDHGFFPKGYTLYHQNSSVATSGTLTTMLSGSDIVLIYVVPHNYLEVTTTVPSNIFGSGLDPRFSFTYDMTITMHIPIVSTAHGLEIASAVATISNVSKPDSHNFTADQAATIVSIIKIFGGPDFIAQLQASIGGVQFPITQQLQQLLGQANSPLQQLSQQGYPILTPVRTKGTQLIALRAAPAETTLKLVVSRLNDMVNVDPKYRNLVHTFARVRFCNTDVAGQTSGTAEMFARALPSDVRIVPIHVDIQRDVHIVITGTGSSTQIEPQGVKIGVIRSIDLTYDRTTGRFTGPVTGEVGREIGVLSDTSFGIAFTVEIDDNGPKPPASRFTDRVGSLQLHSRP